MWHIFWWKCLPSNLQNRGWICSWRSVGLEIFVFPEFCLYGSGWVQPQPVYHPCPSTSNKINPGEPLKNVWCTCIHLLVDKCIGWENSREMELGWVGETAHRCRYYRLAEMPNKHHNQQASCLSAHLVNNGRAFGIWWNWWRRTQWAATSSTLALARTGGHAARLFLFFVSPAFVREHKPLNAHPSISPSLEKRWEDLLPCTFGGHQQKFKGSWNLKPSKSLKSLPEWMHKKFASSQLWHFVARPEMWPPRGSICDCGRKAGWERQEDQDLQGNVPSHWW